MANTVVFLGNNFVADLDKPKSVIYSLGFVILNLFTSPEFIQAIFPFQYSGLVRLGVPPNSHLHISPMVVSLTNIYSESIKFLLNIA